MVLLTQQAIIRNIKVKRNDLARRNRARDGERPDADVITAQGELIEPHTQLTVALRCVQAAARGAWHGPFCGCAWLARVRCFHVTIAIFIIYY
jgi:hypothetical protein